VDKELLKHVFPSSTMGHFPLQTANVTFETEKEKWKNW
jgi:hypothetical protein